MASFPVPMSSSSVPRRWFLSLIWPDFVGVFIRDMHFKYKNIKEFFSSSNVYLISAKEMIFEPHLTRFRWSFVFVYMLANRSNSTLITKNNIQFCKQCKLVHPILNRNSSPFLWSTESQVSRFNFFWILQTISTLNVQWWLMMLRFFK